MPDGTTPLDAYDRKCVALIREHGWMVQHVVPALKDPPDAVPFAYTVGLTPAGLPELVMAGRLRTPQCHRILNMAARRCLNADPDIKGGDTLEEITEEPLRVVYAPYTPAGMALRLFGHDKVRVLQLLWPDREGRYPGEAGWSLGAAQPVFDTPQPDPRILRGGVT